MKKLLTTGLICLSIQACTHVDDYFLGKDNTPKPAVLPQMESKVKVVKNWSAPTGSADQAKGYNKRKPVIQGGRVYTADSKGLVQALDANSAKPYWSVHLSSGVASGPVVKSGIIALGMMDSNLVVLNAENGKELWKAKLSGEILANPVLSKDAIFVKTLDGNVYAFEKSTGAKRWMANHGAPDLVLKASSAPVIMGDLLLVGFSDGKLDAYDVKNGSLAWQHSIAYATGASDVERLIDIDADPIIENNMAYLASYQGYLGAFNLSDGQFIWRKPASVYKNMTLGSDSLYLTDSDDVIWSIAKKTGKVNWKQDSLKARGLTEPVLVNNHLVVGDKTGILHVLALDSGELQGRTQLAGPIETAPVIQSSKLFVQTANGVLNQLSIG